MKVWRIRVIGKSPTIRDVADRSKTYYAEFKYEKSKRGNWSMTHDYQQDRLYAGVAPNINRAMDLALRCAKKDGLKNPEIIEVVRYGNCDFGLKSKKKKRGK